MPATQPPVILLTGATSGIGQATARQLATADARLILHGRTEAKARAACEELADHATAELEPEAADLADLDAVRALAGRVRQRHQNLDVLINNAGLAGGKPHVWTVNVLAPFLLARALRPVLATAGGGRIVNVASAAQNAVDLDALPQDPEAPGPTSYGQSKLALVMLTLEMASRWHDAGITANAVHPGTLLDTPMVRESFGPPRGRPEEGAEVLVQLALDPRLAGITGRYFDQDRVAEPAPQAREPAARRRLWDSAERLIAGRGTA
jgi:NAD(P)-dependent dehydrogenase (short-subunit alcohol dehydrogenase family)